VPGRRGPATPVSRLAGPAWRRARGLLRASGDAGREAAIDFTHATELGVTIAGDPFPHLPFEFVLSYSHWTWVAIAFGKRDRRAGAPTTQVVTRAGPARAGPRADFADVAAYDAFLQQVVAYWRNRALRTVAAIEVQCHDVRHESGTRCTRLHPQAVIDSIVAERVGFEPTCRLPDKTLSRRSRYDHFGTSPVGVISCSGPAIISDDPR
jgi:hypothetical protein